MGAIRVRPEDGIVRVRMEPEIRHSNLRGHMHGGALLGFMDIALFAAARGFGVLTAGPASTIELSAQFIAGAELSEPVEARVELLRETARMLFLRAVITQSHGNVASFSGIVRKPTSR
ncbi:MAG: PaaI family thioesterase [Sphingomonadales bacterium]|nr:MAG: PaaI family thioesterase [Sphingomonadales bacterium]